MSSDESKNQGNAASDDTIGPYRILGILGQGGMGTVYRAQQVAPVQREVALKVVRFGMDSEQFLARFQFERQALATMSHPNIAVVHDAGTTRHAMPYFVMELLNGEPINEYCDRRQLGIEARLKIFRDVCNGIQHAHQKGIIHRDIKPSNILVVEDDQGLPVPKVIDFGMAKQIEGDEKTRHQITEFGLTVGTPLYMCPEQLERSSDDLDTRSDVYSLGVLLYELLTGDYPFDLNNVSRARVFHVILSEEPPRPSDRLRALVDPHQSAEARGLSVTALERVLRGDLDWMVLRAIEKDRDRRYQSVAQFADDITRYLSHEPIQAGPPTKAYRLRKFIRRNRLAAATIGLFFLSLVAGVVGTSLGMARALRAKEHAELAQAQANATVEYLRRVLASADPFVDGRKLKVDEMLQIASNTVETDLVNQPEVVASIRQTIGWTFLELGLYEQAQEELNAAALLQKRVLGDHHLTTLETVNALGRVYYKQGKYDAAERIHRDVLDKQVSLLGANHPTTQWTVYNLAKALDRLGRVAEAERLYRQNVQVRRETLGDEHPHTLVSLTSLSLLLSRIGRHTEAINLQRDNLDKLQRILGPDHPTTLNSQSNLAVILASLKMWDEACQMSRETAEQLTRVLGKHPETFLSEELNGRCLLQMGEIEEAVTLQRANLRNRMLLLGEDHPHTIRSQVFLAEALDRRGDVDEARELFAEARQNALTHLEPHHHDIALAHLYSARFLANLKHYEEAARVFRYVEDNSVVLEFDERRLALEVGKDILGKTERVGEVDSLRVLFN